MKNKRKVIRFRRKRTGKTDYKKRIACLSSGLPRLVVRKSLKNITAQIIAYEPKGDKVLASASSQSIKKLGWNASGGNIPSAYLVGYLAGKRAKDAKISHAVLDLGLQNPAAGSRLYAALKGAVDAGLDIPYDESVIPKQERIHGKHIADYRKIDIKKMFDEVLQKIKDRL